MKNYFAHLSLSTLLTILIIIGVTDTHLICQPYQEMIEQGGHTVKEIQKSAEDYFLHKDKGQGSGYKQWKRWEYDALRRMDENGYLISDQYYYQEWARYNQFLNNENINGRRACMGDWKPLGPTEIKGWAEFDQGIGRLTSIAIDPHNENHIIVGSQTAGVWRTDDGGMNWRPLSDFLVTLQVYSLAIDPQDSNIYYWGTTQGVIYKSVDGGSTWQDLEFDGRGFIYHIKINPNNSNELWASDTQYGIFHSIDGGLTWMQVVNDRCFDIEFHPTDTNLMYASGHHLWRSTDGGYTFEMLDVDFTVDQPMMISVSDAAPSNLYVLQCINKGFEGLYISQDLGETFEKKDQGSTNLLGFDIEGRDGSGQSPRTMDVAVSDADSDEIFIAGINMWRSLDGGTSFDIISYSGYSDNFPNLAYTHADIEILVYENGHLFIGSDGGFYRMDDPDGLIINKSSIEDLSIGLNIQQIYRIGLAQSDTLIMSIGAQDNGSSVLRDGKWRHFAGGDGTETFIIDDANKTIFGSSQYGSLNFSVDSGYSSQPVVGLAHLTSTGKWITPFEKDPNDKRTIYVGYDRVYRSNDLGLTFDGISHDFYPSEIKVAKTGSDTIYSCSANNLYMTTDGGATDWQRILFANVNRDEINYIAVHPRNARLVALAVAGANNVLVTRDAGENWEIWDDDLPAFQALTIVWQDNDEEALYLGMDVGIYYSDKNNRAWRPFNFGLPNVKVNEIEINYVTNELFAGTYGRGVWVSPLCDKSMTGTGAQPIFSELIVAPNPVIRGQDILVEANEIGKVEVYLFDQAGILVHRQQNIDLVSGYRFNTRMIPGGIYYLRMKHANGTVVRKVVVH